MHWHLFWAKVVEVVFIVPVPCLCSLFIFPAFVNSENAGKSTYDIFMWPVDALALVLVKGGGSCIYCICNTLKAPACSLVLWCCDGTHFFSAV